MNRFSKLLILLAAFALVVAACSDDSDDTTTTTEGGAEETTTTAGETTTTAEETTTTGAEAMEPYHFWASLPLTGGFAEVGRLHDNGYAFCVEEINRLGGLDGHAVEYHSTDNGSEPEQVVSDIQRQIEVEGADVLLGTFSSLLNTPASTTARDAGYVYPIPSGGAMRIWVRGYENIFYFQQAVAELIGGSPLAMIDYYIEQGVIDPPPATVSIVAQDDPFAGAIVTGLIGGDVIDPGSGDVLAEVEGFLNSPDVDIEAVYIEKWPEEGFTDWITLAQSLKDANADMVFAGTASLVQAVELVNAMATVDYQPKLVYMSQGAQNQFLETVGDNANNITIHAAWHPSANFESTLAGQPYTNQDFIDGYTAFAGEPPDEDVAIPFATCQGMAQAILGAGSSDQAAMQQWLHDRTADDPVTSVLGDFYWDERGLPLDRSHIMVQWQDGVLNFVYPVGEFPGTVDLVYPKAEFQ